MLGADTDVHRLSYDDVFRMVEAGVLAEEDRVELVDGVLVDMSPPGADHSALVAWLNHRFVTQSGERREVRVQDLLIVEGGFLMPDLMVIDRPARGGGHPSTALLVAEVSGTTQRHDAWKAGRYALAGVGEYWIVDVPARRLSVHRRPGPKGYGRVDTYTHGDRVATPVLAAPVDLSELLAPAS